MQAAVPETPALRDEGGPAKFDRVDSLPDSEFSFRAHLPPPLEERESPNLRRKENARPASSAAPQPLASRDALSAAQPVPLGAACSNVCVRKCLEYPSQKNYFYDRDNPTSLQQTGPASVLFVCLLP